MTTFDTFDAYYRIDTVVDGLPVLFGARKECAVQVAPDVWLVRQAKDYLGDTDLMSGVMADFSLGAADPEYSVFAWSMLNNFPPDTSVLHPAARYLVELDIAAGLGPEEIIERRAAIIVSEFLGFEPAHVAMVRPELFAMRTETIDGVEVETCDWRGGIIA